MKKVRKSMPSRVKWHRQMSGDRKEPGMFGKLVQKLLLELIVGEKMNMSLGNKCPCHAEPNRPWLGVCVSF